MPTNETLVPPEVVWFFQSQTGAKEPLAEPANHLTDFKAGIAEFIPAFHGLVDAYGETLIPNYSQDQLLEESGVIVPALISERRRVVAEQFHEQRGKRPIVIVAPHPSIATPYLIARALNQPFDEATATHFYSTVGPRPMLFDYVINKQVVSPFGLGVALNNLLLTGTNTGSTDSAPDVVKDWLDEQAKQFKANVNEIMEPKEQGDNNVLIVCPSGRLADFHKGKMTEFLPRSYSFAAKLADRALYLPVGIFDTLIRDSIDPTSLVHFHPDSSTHSISSADEDERKNALYNLHLHALELSNCELGSIRMQSRVNATSQRIGRQVMKYGKVHKTAHKHRQNGA